MSNGERINLFSRFALDLARGCLLNGNEEVHLRPQSYEVLKYLVENSGHLISKNKLIEEVWKGRAVTDGSLGKCIEEVREALGPEAAKYVRNVRGRGYIFDTADEQKETIAAPSRSEQIEVVRVTVEDHEEADQASPLRLTDLPRAIAAPRRRINSRAAVVIVIGFLIAVIGAFFVYQFFTNRVSGVTPIKSIAVIPFQNQSGNSDVDYLSDGMTESLIDSLSQLPGVSVKAPSVVFRYRNKEVEPQQIASELAVQAILNGRFVQHGNDLTLYLSLVDGRTGNQIWGDQYNRKLTDLVAVQHEITRDVSQTLQARLSRSDEEKLTKNFTGNSEAYQLYLKGKYEWKKHTQADLQKAIEYFNQALAKDPTYALAYAGLGASYTVLGNNYLPPNETYPKATEYAGKALAINEALPETHVAMGASRLYYERNWAEAERELKRALTLDPNNAEAINIYADYLDAMGRLDESKAEMKRAQEIDPLSVMYGTNLGAAFYYSHQYDEAIAQIEKAIDLEPSYTEAYLYLGQAYEQKQLYPQALEVLQRGIARSERHPKLIAALGHAYALAGQRDKALKAVDELREMSKQRYLSPYWIALVYAGLGDREQTLLWLEKAYQEHAFFLIWLKVEPAFDPLRDDPKFQDLLRRVRGE